MNVTNDALRIETIDRKYVVVLSAEGELMAQRYGQPWRDCIGDQLILTLAQDIETLRGRLHKAEAENARLRHELSENCKFLLNVQQAARRGCGVAVLSEADITARFETALKYYANCQYEIDVNGDDDRDENGAYGRTSRAALAERV